jgi:hypothetical protein
MPTTTAKVELEVREGYLFINAPDGPNARVVDDKHVVHEVNEYQDGVARRRSATAQARQARGSASHGARPTASRHGDRGQRIGYGHLAQGQ